MSAHDTITAAVCAAMRARGTSRAQLARDLGRPRGWVTGKLNGHRGWLVDHLDALAVVFGMPSSKLLVPPADEPASRRARRDSNPQPSDP